MSLKNLNRLLFGVVFILILELSSINSVYIEVENLEERCDFSKCTASNPNKINVHLIPHTHDDVGWLKTVDQYYYGSNRGQTNDAVQYILDTVVEELIRDKKRRFIYVETAFFWKWWLEQNEKQRAIVKELVKTGQLEFINGGWSMPDEAVVHYNSFIDQTSWGLKMLNDTFGHCGQPRVTWMIDCFGHSREIASLFAQMNYDAMFFAREDYQEHDFRRSHRTMEHVWQGSDDLKEAGDLFVGLLDRHYSPPSGFNFDLGKSNDKPIIDNPESEEYNVPERVKQFVSYTKNYAKNYATNNVMFLMGDDFTYMGARAFFKNMDKLIHAVNDADQGVNVFYSTPSCYTKSLNDAHVNWTSKTYDYFPLGTGDYDYWSGYFTSRPTLKKMERYGNNLLQACKQLDVLAGNNGKFDSKITKLREAMGVLQHHDAITGTELQHVTFDYAKQLQTGFDNCYQVISRSYSKIAEKKNSSINVNQVFCDYLNISACSITEQNRNILINVFNPLGHTLINQTLRIPVDWNSNITYQIRKLDDKLLDSFLIPIPEKVKKLAERKFSKANHELVFKSELPALGFRQFLLEVFPSENGPSKPARQMKKIKINKETTIKSKNFDVVFNAKGELTHLVLSKNKKISFNQTFHFYKDDSNRYFFRVRGQNLIGHLKDAELIYDEQSNLKEVHQHFDSSYIDQVIRIDSDRDQLEFEFVVGPVPMGDNVGKSIITRYNTDLKSNRTFYTDSNGRQILKRVWNKHPEFKYHTHEEIASNYFPITSRLFIQDIDQKLQFTVLNDRAQGGSSVRDGEIELMIHRRLLSDGDLNEPGVDGQGLVVRARHLVLLGSIDQSAGKHRTLAQHLFMEPILSFSQSENSKKLMADFSGIKTSLPPNIHLLTLEQWNNAVLIRLEHFYQKNEDSELSAPTKINLKNLFSFFEMVEVEELTLGANQNVENLKQRLKFNYSSSSNDFYRQKDIDSKKLDNKELEITLNPMQIRTFLVHVKHEI